MLENEGESRNGECRTGSGRKSFFGMEELQNLENTGRCGEVMIWRIDDAEMGAWKRVRGNGCRKYVRRSFAICVHFFVGNVDFDGYGNGCQKIVCIFGSGIRYREI